MPHRQLVKDYHVSGAVEALISFCQKHGEPEEIKRPHTIVRFAIALREGDSFEWTPCSREFRRILTVEPEYQSGKVALVFGYDGYDGELTAELNDGIFKATGGALGVAR